jgi:hypothetical protein
VLAGLVWALWPRAQTSMALAPPHVHAVETPAAAPPTPAAVVASVAPILTTTHVHLETVPPGLVIIDGAGLQLGVTPLDVDTSLSKLSLRVRIGDVLSPARDVVVHDGTVVVDFSDWPPLAKKTARRVATPSRTTPAPTTSTPAAPTTTPPNVGLLEGKPSVQLLDGAKPGIGRVDEEKPSIGTLE